MASLVFARQRLVFFWCRCLISGLLLLSGGAAAQQPAATHCLLLPLAPAERARQATLIVEGQVLDAVGVWDAARGHVFTRHRLRVFSVLKGALADTAALTLVTEGGAAGRRREELTNTLRLEPGAQGVFFLTAAAGPAWLAYGSEQGFVRYDLTAATASAPFESYPAIDAAFYQALAGPAALPRRVLRPNPALLAARQGQRLSRRGTQATTVSALVPARITAGTGAVLTITGIGFGESRGVGQVRFANADDGGRTFVAARDEDYLRWTDGQIQVRVPSLSPDRHPAGSGLVQVLPAGQTAVLSPQPLTVIFALANAENATTGALDQPGHANVNGRGGLSFQLTAAFQASPAAAAWRRALGSWRCQTGVNWDEDPAPAPASSAVANDQRSVVSFDGGSGDPALPAGVLGRTTSYYTGCFSASGELVFAAEEIDMQFSSTALFQFGPALAVVPQIDFETVAVHELGHAQQLAHLIRPGAVMHYAVARGQTTRQLDPASDVAGGRLVLRRRSFVDRGCGRPAMLPAPLSSFTLDAAAPTPTLSWSTRDECFLTGFVVERSLGADTLAWQPLATLPLAAAGASYRYTDAQPAPGLRYYRLRLRRPDGSLDGAAPVAVSAGVLAGEVQFFPNPVAGEQLRFAYAASAAGSLIFVLYDELGRYRRLRVAAVRAELNVLSLSLTGVPPGFYVLTWRDAQSGRHGSQRLVRQ